MVLCIGYVIIAYLLHIVLAGGLNFSSGKRGGPTTKTVFEVSTVDGQTFEMALKRSLGQDDLL